MCKYHLPYLYYITNKEEIICKRKGVRLPKTVSYRSKISYKRLSQRSSLTSVFDGFERMNVFLLGLLLVFAFVLQKYILTLIMSW